MPVTTPVDEPTVALALLLIHVPPLVASVKVVVEPIHTELAPEIAAGIVLIDITNVVKQPVGNV